MSITFSIPFYLTIAPIIGTLTAIVCLIAFRKPKRSLLRRLLYTLSTTLTVTLICIAFAEPFTIQEVAIPDNNELIVLFEESASMKHYQLPIEQIQAQLDGYVPYKTIVFGTQNETPFFSRTLASMQPNTDILVVSDGQDTQLDFAYSDLISKANEINVRFHRVNLSTNQFERSIYLLGPQTTIAGIENTYQIVSSGQGAIQRIVVTQDDEVVFETTNLDNTVFTQTFTQEGTYSYKVELFTDRDLDTTNNVFYKTTRVIPKPPVLYVGNDAQMITFLNQFTATTTAQTIPQNLSAYVAVILHNQHARQLQNAQNLVDFVAEGNGLVVIGGDQAFEFSNYDASSIAPLLPVTQGRPGQLNQAAIAVVIDVSASTGSTDFTEFSSNKVSDVIRLLSYDIIQSLPADTLISVVGFSQEPYLINRLEPLGPSRASILDKISRLKFDGAGTQINRGLQAAWKTLEATTGAKSIIIITDGLPGGSNDPLLTVETSRQLGQAQIPIYSIGVGVQSGEGTLRQMAKESNGIYLAPRERDRLQIVFRDTNRDTPPSPLINLITVNSDHPITQNVPALTTQLSSTNFAIPKPFANLLVGTTNGDPAVVSWRYGLGRVTTVHTFTGEQSMGTLMSPPDSRLLARIVSYAIGDPEKKLPPSIRIDDTTIEKPARVIASGPLPTHTNLLFTSLTNELHASYLSANQTGIQSAYGATFAVSYITELQKLDIHPHLSQLVDLTQGQSLRVEQLRTIKEYMLDTSQLTQSKTIPLQTIPILLATIIFMVLLIARKLEERRT